MNTSLRLVGLASITWLALACAPPGPGSDESSDSDDSAVYADSHHLWTSHQIPVCWENGSDADKEQRGWVESAVANTWEAVSTIDFVGWGACGSNDGGSIRIQIKDDNDDGPKVHALGSALAGMKNGMILNFTFQKWTTGNGIDKDCRDDLEFCIRAVAAHEFGHALGFAHEQNRPETDKSWCNQDQGSNGDVEVGTWDENSIMNYCNPRWNNAGQLSDKDIAAIRLLYGDAGLGGFIVNKLSDKCLDVSAASFDEGAPVISYSCSGDANQRWWRLDAGEGTQRLQVRHSGQCLAIEGFSKDAGARAVQAPCGGGDAQRWVIGNGFVINQLSGLCLDVADDSPAEGVGLIQWNCNGGDNQRFTLY